MGTMPGSDGGYYARLQQEMNNLQQLQQAYTQLQDPPRRTRAATGGRRTDLRPDGLGRRQPDRRADRALQGAARPVAAAVHREASAGAVAQRDDRAARGRKARRRQGVDDRRGAGRGTQQRGGDGAQPRHEPRLPEPAACAEPGRRRPRRGSRPDGRRSRRRSRNCAAASQRSRRSRPSCRG